MTVHRKKGNREKGNVCKTFISEKGKKIKKGISKGGGEGGKKKRENPANIFCIKGRKKEERSQNFR